MPASLAACSRGRPSSALASASRRALTRPSRSRRASRRSSAASRSVRMDKGAGTAAPPRRMPLECLRRPIDPSPARRAGMSGRFVAVPLDDPALVVGLPKGDEGQAKLLDRVEAADPQQVFLQGADEPLGAVVALGLADEGR